MKASSRAFCSAAETKRDTVVTLDKKHNLRLVVPLIQGRVLPFYVMVSPLKEIG